MTIETPPLPVVEGGWPCILADPPWRFIGRNGKPGSRSADAHYATMKIADIKALPVADIAAKDAHLFLWGVWGFLPQALEVISAWGFTYSSSFNVWMKLNARDEGALMVDVRSLFMSGGLTTRKNTEFCLLARRGKPKKLSNAVREAILAPVREHSRKPDDTKERIEAYCPGPRLELFSRENRDGWTAWGFETGRFDDKWKGSV